MTSVTAEQMKDSMDLGDKIEKFINAQGATKSVVSGAIGVVYMGMLKYYSTSTALQLHAKIQQEIEKRGE